MDCTISDMEDTTRSTKIYYDNKKDSKECFISLISILSVNCNYQMKLFLSNSGVKIMSY